MFTGFDARDFDAYAPQKWRSNVFTRERLEVKQKLSALGKQLATGLAGADGSPLAVEATAEYPALSNHKQVEAQHVYLFRNEGARRELDAIIDRARPLAQLIDDPAHEKNHLLLALTIANDALAIALKLHPEADVDRRNLERKCEDFFEREKLLGLLTALPEEFRIGLLPPHAASAGPAAEAATPTRTLDAEALATTLGRFGGGSNDCLHVGRVFARDDARLLSPEFEAEARISLHALLPLYHFVAWTRDNDFVSMREVLKQEKQARKHKHLARNDRVRIVRGMFAGKAGVVQELDAKGSTLKILVGKMPVKVDAEDVVKVE